MKIETYICSKCKIEKYISEFGVAKDRTSGHRSQCKECVRLYELANKDRIRIRKQQYRETNKEAISAKRKKYHLDNRDKAIQYYNENKDHILEVKSEHRKSNPEHYAIKNKEYQKSNLDKFSKAGKKHYLKNKTAIQVKHSEYNRTRRNSDPVFKFRCGIRNAVKQSFIRTNNKKVSSSTEILGCSMDFFRSYIESRFEPWMTFDNYGKCNGTENFGWDLDHIVPISSAKTIEDVVRLNHYTNFQPLCSYINRVIKKDKIAA